MCMCMCMCMYLLRTACASADFTHLRTPHPSLDPHAHPHLTILPSQVSDIERLISERGQAKLKQQYAEADALLDELWGRHGVTVDDRARSWRVDGGGDGGYGDDGYGDGYDNGRYTVYGERRQEGGRGGASYGRASDGEWERGGRARGRYDRGGDTGGGYDGGRYERRGEPTRRTDRGYDRGQPGQRPQGRGTKLNAAGHDYTRSARDDFEVDGDLLAQIDALLGRRLAAKKARDFPRADVLQSELRDLGVEVRDLVISAPDVSALGRSTSKISRSAISAPWRANAQCHARAAHPTCRAATLLSPA